jgi:hypothetical protein
MLNVTLWYHLGESAPNQRFNNGASRCDDPDDGDSHGSQYISHYPTFRHADEHDQF